MPLVSRLDVALALLWGFLGLCGFVPRMSSVVLSLLGLGFPLTILRVSFLPQICFSEVIFPVIRLALPNIRHEFETGDWVFKRGLWKTCLGRRSLESIISLWAIPQHAFGFPQLWRRPSPNLLRGRAISLRNLLPCKARTLKLNQLCPLPQKLFQLVLRNLPFHPWFRGSLLLELWSLAKRCDVCLGCHVLGVVRKCLLLLGEG